MSDGKEGYYTKDPMPPQQQTKEIIIVHDTHHEPHPPEPEGWGATGWAMIITAIGTLLVAITGLVAVIKGRRKRKRADTNPKILSDKT